jgi:hypothetical protein
MTNNKFAEDDKQKVIDFLNYVADNASFTHKTDGVIKYFKLLSYMQNSLLPKINDNIFEIKKIVEPEKPQKSTKKK